MNAILPNPSKAVSAVALPNTGAIPTIRMMKKNVIEITNNAFQIVGFAVSIIFS